MTDEEKTKEQLLQELAELRAQLSVAQDRNNELVQLCDELEEFVALSDIAAQFVGVGIWKFNLKTGQCTVNEGWLKYLGYSLDEIVSLGAGAPELIHENDRERVTTEFLKVVKGEQNLFEDKYQRRSAAGAHIWIDALCWVHGTEPDGKPCSIAMVEFDNWSRIYLEKYQACLESRDQAIRNAFASMYEATLYPAVLAETLYKSDGIIALDFKMEMLCFAIHLGAEKRREHGKGQFYVKDDAFRYVYVSPEMTRSFGMVSSDFFGRTDGEIFGIDEGGKEEELVRRFETEKSVRFQFSRVRDGKPTVSADWMIPVLDETRTRPIWILGFPEDFEPGYDLELTDAMPYISKAAQEALETALRVAETDCTVLLTGETGSGKDWMARYIHCHSKRKNEPFFLMNCPAISIPIAESELFGHKKGSFTDATDDKPGLLEQAQDGTLFLNEIGRLSLTIQAKLLTFLDTREILRVGETKARKVNARLLAATSMDLASEVAQGRFLKDLYFRLNAVPIEVPPLRLRMEDLPILVEEITKELQSEMNLLNPLKLPFETRRRLREYEWPGNVRELRGAMERGALFSRNGVITPDLLGLAAKPASSLPQPESILQNDDPGTESGGDGQEKLVAAIDRFNRCSREEQRSHLKELFVEVCGRATGSQRHIADILGTTDETVRKELKATMAAGAQKGRPRKMASKEMIARIKRYLIERV